MATVYDCTDPEQRAEGMTRARDALERGELVVIPTDTVYGIAADAFNPAAVERLQHAKGSGRQAPPAVLVADTVTINRLAMRVPGAVHQLTPRFWPGPLTIVLQAQAGLEWDLGDTDGAVAVRMPRDEVALELLREAGPLAVSSANAVGLPPATSAAAAAEAFGDVVAVVLDGGRGSAGQDDHAVDADDAGADIRTSTILDATAAVATGKYRVLRHGAVSVEQLRIALGETAVVDLDAPDAAADADADASAAADADAPDAADGSGPDDAADAAGAAQQIAG